MRAWNHERVHACVCASVRACGVGQSDAYTPRTTGKVAHLEDPQAAKLSLVVWGQAVTRTHLAQRARLSASRLSKRPSCCSCATSMRWLRSSSLSADASVAMSTCKTGRWCGEERRVGGKAGVMGDGSGQGTRAPLKLEGGERRGRGPRMVRGGVEGRGW
eukprot:356473-Chlamydomonas_euryale.AAC.1